MGSGVGVGVGSGVGVGVGSGVGVGVGSGVGAMVGSTVGVGVATLPPDTSEQPGMDNSMATAKQAVKSIRIVDARLIRFMMTIHLFF